MANLQSILSIGRSSLVAHQSAIATASNNTANADVAGFAKRDVLFSSRTLDGGVGINAIRRRADAWVDQRLLFERSRLGTHMAQSQGLTSVELQLDSGEGGLGPLMDAFFGSVSTLSSNPTDVQSRSDVIAAGDSLAEAFRAAAARIELERSQADNALSGAVDDVNALTAEIARLSSIVEQAEAAGGEASAERDRRDLLLGQLAELVPIDTLVDDGGSLIVLTDGGQALVQGPIASTLRATPDAALGGRLRVDMVNNAGLVTDVTATLREGRLGGLLALRDDTLQDLGARIDTLAFDLATAFNATHSAGFGLDGVGGRDFFSAPAAIPGAAASLNLAAGLADNPGWIAAAANAATAIGGNDNLLLLATLSETNAAGGGSRTFAEEFASIVAEAGRRSADGRLGIEQGELQVTQAQAIKDAQTGVSLDEELMDITRFERAYQAAARVISTVDELYQTVLSL